MIELPEVRISRRGFMGIILASMAAPSIVRANSLMKVVTPGAILLPDTQIALLPDGWSWADVHMSMPARGDIQTGRTILATGRDGVRYHTYPIPGMK